MRDRIDQFERERSFIYPPNYGVAAQRGGPASPKDAATADAKAAAPAAPAATAATASVASRYSHEYAELHCDLMDKIDAYVRAQVSSHAPAATIINSLQNQLVLEASARRLERMCFNDQLLQLQQSQSEHFVKAVLNGDGGTAN